MRHFKDNEGETETYAVMSLVLDICHSRMPLYTFEALLVNRYFLKVSPQINFYARFGFISQKKSNLLSIYPPQQASSFVQILIRFVETIGKTILFYWA